MGDLSGGEGISTGLLDGSSISGVVVGMVGSISGGGEGGGLGCEGSSPGVEAGWRVGMKGVSGSGGWGWFLRFSSLSSSWLGEGMLGKGSFVGWSSCWGDCWLMVVGRPLNVAARGGMCSN